MLRSKKQGTYGPMRPLGHGCSLVFKLQVTADQLIFWKF
ncbi:hypothetical protein Poly41_33100 [Novipirellula artificiosorum]|uniref:Uncharacterized protein n=1 Tax=Novipirellula artificiosorum TaxID=2528016 RepID=A0A5C6DII8_9BACT|nr:hypothetical protein Poly41_33100 [Novipirellula artificiosorum]